MADRAIVGGRRGWWWVAFSAREPAARELLGPMCTFARLKEVRECSADDFHELGDRLCPAKLAKWCQREQLYR